MDSEQLFLSYGTVLQVVVDIHELHSCAVVIFDIWSFKRSASVEWRNFEENKVVLKFRTCTLNKFSLKVQNFKVERFASSYSLYLSATELAAGDICSSGRFALSREAAKTDECWRVWSEFQVQEMYFKWVLYKALKRLSVIYELFGEL